MAAAVGRNSTFLLLYVAALLILSAHSADGRREDEHNKVDLVSQACWNASQIDDLPQETCERFLRSDKRSATAKEPRDLVLIAIDLVDRAAAEVDAKLEKQDQGAVVQICRLYSSLVAHIVPLYRGEVHGYKPGDDNAVLCRITGDVTYAAQNCWYYIKHLPDNHELKKAVGKQANDANDLGDLVHDMLVQMMPPADDDYPPHA